MQISSASLLAAQTQVSAQPKPQASVFGSFLKAPEAKPEAAFEPVDFARPEPQKAAPAAAPDPAQAYRKPGSAIDIRV